MSAWGIAILPLVGVIVGAAVQFWLSRTAEREKAVQSLRTAAYVDYLRSVAAAGHLRSDDDLRDAHRDAADAKARIAVYGSASVIHALAQFEESGAVLNSAPAYQAFLHLVSVMRPNAEEIVRRDIEFVLFGSDRCEDSKDQSTSSAQ